VTEERKGEEGGKGGRESFDCSFHILANDERQPSPAKDVDSPEVTSGIRGPKRRRLEDGPSVMQFGSCRNALSWKHRLRTKHHRPRSG